MLIGYAICGAFGAMKLATDKGGTKSIGSLVRQEYVVSVPPPPPKSEKEEDGAVYASDDRSPPGHGGKTGLLPN